MSTIRPNDAWRLVHDSMHVDGVANEACPLCIANDVERDATSTLDDVTTSGRMDRVAGILTRAAMARLDFAEDIREGRVELVRRERGAGRTITYRVKE